jgi:starvation-inducible DNA-binding protein
MQKEPVLNVLKTLLSNYYALYVKTQNYHWNVEGATFYMLHEQFEDQYKNLAEAIDTVAEHIRSLGGKTPASLTYFNNNTSIKPGNENFRAPEMIQDLLGDHQSLLTSLASDLVEVEKAGDQVVMDYMIERMTYHRKVSWMLKSCLS